MTERTLALRTAHAGAYFVLATDFPSARVFDTVTSRLVCSVELPPRSRTSLAALSLTSVAIGAATAAPPGITKKKKGSKATGAATVEEVGLTNPMLAAAGLSDGTVLIHHIQKDELVAHVSVSDTQQAITAMTIQDGFLFCLTANHLLYVLDATDAASLARGALIKVRAQPDASAIAVMAVADADEEAEASGRFVFRVLIAGPTYALHRMELYRATATASTAAEAGKRNASAKVLAFASQGTTVDYAWLVHLAGSHASSGTDAAPSSAPTTTAAVTASANEGVVRVWDVSIAGTGATAMATTAAVGRCRRTLLCGQRIANVSLLDLTGKATADGEGVGAFYVLVTTFTGSVLLWNLGEQLLPRVVEPAPLQPTVAFFSTTPSARLLYGVLVRGDASGVTAAPQGNGVVDAALSLLFVRGKFALPQFTYASAARLIAEQDARLHGGSASTDPTETTDVAPVNRTAQLKKLRKAASAMGLGFSPSLTLVDVPADATGATKAAGGSGTSGGLEDAAGNAFHVMDTAWAANRHRLATKALAMPTETFAATHTYQAATLKDLPVKHLTLEQRLRALSASVAKNAAAARLSASAAAAGSTEEDTTAVTDAEEDNEDAAREAATAHLPSLGLATVPLYQALHANDTSAVMELLSVAARSADGMRATVLSLQLPYALQLLSIISERLGVTSAKATVGAATTTAADVGDKTAAAAARGFGSGGGLSAVSTRSPLLLWLDTLLHYRGMEMYAAQLHRSETQANPTQAHEAEKLQEEAESHVSEGKTQVPTVSPPKDFVAPLLHQYRAMCGTYDKLASLHGRLSVFNAVRPSEKNQFVNRPRKMLSSNIELARTPAALSGKLDATHTVQDDDILFPAMFTELRTSKGPHVVRVRSKLAKEKKLRRMATSDRALLKKAKQMAKESRDSKNKNGGLLGDSDGDDNTDGIDDATMAAALGMDENGMPVDMLGSGGDEDDDDIDLDALEALGLGSSRSGSDDDNDHDHDFSGSSRDASDMDEEPRRGKKTARKERTAVTDEMLADEHSSLEDEDDDDDEDRDAELDSSDAGADFAKDSDDDVDSQGVDLSGSDDEEDEEDEETSASEAGDYDPTANRSDDDDDDGASSSDDDGMGEDMAELLAAQDGDDEDAKQERRKNKRVRTDK